MVGNANLQVPIYRPDQFLTNKDFPEIAWRQANSEVITFPSILECTKKPVVFTKYNGNVMVESSVAIIATVFRAPFFSCLLITTIC